ncbi:MAG: phosphoribosylaminoimidazolesuccinocarboxamide synthase [Bdellovibrionales bacterium]
MSFEKKEFIYEGKAKRLYSTNNDQVVLVEFKDDLTAFNAEKKGSFDGKGKTNLKISQLVFSHLIKNGIKTHLIEQISDTELFVKKVEIIPLEVVIRNKAAGSISKRLGIEKGFEFNNPMFEVFYKKDELGDPLLTYEHVRAMNLCRDENYEKLKTEALKINGLLKDLFAQAGVDLVDFKIEFGLDQNGALLLADEISPDSCRLWDLETGEVLDKDRFRQDMGKVSESYQVILEKLEKVVVS